MRRGLLFSVAVMAITTALTGCGQKPDNSYSGYVESQTVSIAAPQSGWLTAVNVDRGDAVSADELLFTLDSTQAQATLAGAENRAVAAQATAQDLAKGARPADIAPLEAQRIQAQAQLDLAQANEARYAKLEPQGFVSASQMDSLRAATRSAKAEVANLDTLIQDKELAARGDQQKAAQAQAAASGAEVAGAQWTVDDREVHARLSGLVDERLREPGEFVAQGSAVLTVRPTGREFVRFYVPQADLARFRVGTVVHVACDGCAGSVAKVRYVSPVAEFTPPVIYSVKERQKLMFLIEATPDKPEELHAGQPVDVSL